jgi:hypothetical protein
MVGMARYTAPGWVSAGPAMAEKTVVAPYSGHKIANVGLAEC